MKSLKFKKIFIIVILVIFVLAGTFFANANSIIKIAQAQLFPGFGGFVVDLIPCTCTGNFWLFMSPFYGPAFMGGGALVFQPGLTTIYSWYAIPVIGVWLLGDYIPGVQSCFLLIPSVPPVCVPIPGGGIMRQVGTSL